MEDKKKTDKKGNNKIVKKTVDKKLRKTLEGYVTGIVDENTVKVQIERKFAHKKYGKIIKTHKRYLVHKSSDTKVDLKDFVRIGEIKPISKRKSWEILK